jgi:hypothetical protein
MNIQTISLLRCLRPHLARTVNSWTRFDSSSGDIAFFSDITNNAARVSLGNIRESFEDLSELEIDLRYLDDSMKEICKIVSAFPLPWPSLTDWQLELRISVEANQLQFESMKLNRKTHELNFQTSLLSRDIDRLPQHNGGVNRMNHATAQLDRRFNHLVHIIFLQYQPMITLERC